MTPPPLGLILTHAPDLAWLQQQLALARADVLKVVTGWGLAGGWTPAARYQACRMAPAIIVRTVSGDPSVPDHGMLVPSRAVDEIRPWWEARDPTRPFYAELGNEPLIAPAANEDGAWAYQWALGKCIDDLRRAFPGIRIIGPAQLLNHPIPLGAYPDGATRFLAICAPALRRCDALATHAYTAEQLTRGVKLLRDLVSATLPIWATEVNLNVALDDAARGRALAALTDTPDLAGVCLYHLASSAGEDPIHFNPNYTLRPGTLAALAAARETPVAVSPAPSDPDTVHHTQVRLQDFLMDVRQWRTVEAFRRHLRQYDARAVAPWASGVTVHHTWKPVAADWRGAAAILAMARYYRTSPDLQWDRGPHLFSVSGASDPRNDGIWQMTPLNERGIHAKSFNATRWGWEVVGDFDQQPWDAGTAALALGGLAAIHDWAGWQVSPATLGGHRDDPQTAKTCPGAQVDLASVRRGVAALVRGRL